ncbi:hypothetical protein ABB37_00456 [Leptomonas pyrrhocoris]|uniref:Proteophosphoglycan ppg4 n=1 Tax=Leptomonas pyrrhocoris TaxID=157538 RepID=A0A0M9GAL4_LEPPY|nr:hypothetical protein ABB37_00456 [Leptomonas pyrrhocoris]KPA86219.1 hypothetical protein ABB37_00456 [Leptomonas pyrrhocoris]|eukprot:XP_015664658.1 hypothetical protein ABB37_00456 [Leptomonas pyrrhocoris]
MPLLTAFVAAVLLSEACAAASSAVVAHKKGVQHLGRDRLSAVASHLQSGAATTTGSGSTFVDEATRVLLSNSSHPSASLAPAKPHWEAFCGTQAHEKCVALYASAVLVPLVLLSVLCAWWFVRWWRCGSRGLHRWQRLDTFDAEDGDGVVRSTVEVTEREGLRTAEAASHRSDDEGNESAHHEGSHSGDGRLARCVQRLNVRGTRLWTVLRMTPAGLFYSSSQPSSRSQTPPPTQRSFSAPVADETGAESDGDGWNLHRDATAGSASDDHSYLRSVISVATTTTDSSESGGDSGGRSEDGDAAVAARHCLCESECLVEEAAERGRAVGRCTGASRTANRPPTPHILPLLLDYNAASAAGREDEGCELADSKDSDSQRVKRPDEKTRHPSTSSLTASANSSTHTPPDLSGRVHVPHTGPTESVAPHESGDTNANARVVFPHVETAIFDAITTNTGAVGPQRTPSPPIDSSAVNNLFEPDHFPTLASHPLIEAHASSAASLLSGFDSYVPLPGNSGTATPASLRGSSSCVSLLLPASAALPVSNSLSDGLDMDGEEVVREFDTTGHSRSYTPAAQKQQPQQQQQPSQCLAQQQVPPVQPSRPSRPQQQEASKARRKRSSSQYSEPWQPILVSRGTSPLATAAAAVAVLPTMPLSDPMTVLPRGSPFPPRSPTTDLRGAHEDELDDLMLDDGESVPCNQAWESGHIFSGSSTSTSRTVTPATENDPESVVGTPTMFCPAAMANGVNRSRSSNNSDGRIGFATVSPPASASIPLRLKLPPAAVFARTAGAGRIHVGGCDVDSNGRMLPWASCSVGRRPLNLSVEERTLLMKSRKWLFPLIDGADEIESSGVDEGETSRNDEGATAEKSES